MDDIKLKEEVICDNCLCEMEFDFEDVFIQQIVGFKCEKCKKSKIIEI